jgi:hypothetical protein
MTAKNETAIRRVKRELNRALGFERQLLATLDAVQTLLDSVHDDEPPAPQITGHGCDNCKLWQGNATSCARWFLWDTDKKPVHYCPQCQQIVE